VSESALVRGMDAYKGATLSCGAYQRFDLPKGSVRRRTDSPCRFGHAASMSLPIVVNSNSRKPGAGERSEYLIDGFHVSFLHQAEWKCACAEFGTLGTCRHTREAGGMRDAQARIRRRLGSGISDFPPYASGRRAHVLARNRASGA
jgi:hypothetical protein